MLSFGRVRVSINPTVRLEQVSQFVTQVPAAMTKRKKLERILHLVWRWVTGVAAAYLGLTGVVGFATAIVGNIVATQRWLMEPWLNIAIAGVFLALFGGSIVAGRQWLPRVFTTRQPNTLPINTTPVIAPVVPDPLEEIGKMVDSFFGSQPVGKDDREGLIALLDWYRREPWYADPPLVIEPDGTTPDGRNKWRMNMLPAGARTIFAGGDHAALQEIKATLMKNRLIEQMRWWSSWH